MKKLLLLISIIALTIDAFSQLNLNRFEDDKYRQDSHEFTTHIMSDNPEVVTYDVIEYEFTHGRIIEVYLFFDKNSHLLDLILLNKNFNRSYELIDNRRLYWDNERFVRSIEDSDHKIKLKMSDDTYITIGFDFLKHSTIVSDGKKYCVDTYYACLIEDHVDSSTYKFSGYDSNYEYVECK